MFVIYSL